MIVYKVKIGANGDKFWYLDGVLHREDGPAVEWGCGDKEWHLDGVLHRENGPAIESVNCKEWWLDGKLHREDGPAIEYSNGYRAWYLNDVCYTYTRWKVAKFWIKVLDFFLKVDVEPIEDTNLIVEDVCEMTVEEISKALGKKIKIVE